MQQGKFSFYFEAEGRGGRQGSDGAYGAPCALFFIRGDENLCQKHDCSRQPRGAEVEVGHIKLSICRCYLKLRVAPVEVVAALSVVQEQLLIAAPRMLGAFQQQALELGKTIGNRARRRRWLLRR